MTGWFSDYQPVLIQIEQTVQFRRDAVRQFAFGFCIGSTAQPSCIVDCILVLDLPFSKIESVALRCESKPSIFGSSTVRGPTAALFSSTVACLQPDIAAFQESIHNNKCDQVSDLLGPGFHIVHQEKRDPQGMGISIASRWPMHDVQELDLNVTPSYAGFPAGTLLVKMQAPETFLFVNHFPHFQLNFERKRELQAVVAARVGSP